MAGLCNCHNVEKALGAFIDSSSTLIPTLTISCAFTPVLAQISVFALAKVLALVHILVLGLPSIYKNEDLQKTTRLALKSFVWGQKHSQLQAKFTFYKQFFKAWFHNLYYGNSYLDCYQFCQQYENHFKIARANRSNQIFFAALLFHEAVVQQCHQHKYCSKAKDLVI